MNNNMGVTLPYPLCSSYGTFHFVYLLALLVALSITLTWTRHKIMTINHEKHLKQTTTSKQTKQIKVSRHQNARALSIPIDLTYRL